MIAADYLQRAIEYLGAVEVAPGRYAFRVDDTARHEAFALWGVCDAGDLVGGGDGPSRWTQMPIWWTLERRYVWRMTFRPLGKEGTPHRPGFHFERFFTTEGQARRVLGDSPDGYILERITADLTTGEEIPA